MYDEKLQELEKRLVKVEKRDDYKLRMILLVLSFIILILVFVNYDTSNKNLEKIKEILLITPVLTTTTTNDTPSTTTSKTLYPTTTINIEKVEKIGKMSLKLVKYYDEIVTLSVEETEPDGVIRGPIILVGGTLPNGEITCIKDVEPIPKGGYEIYMANDKMPLWAYCDFSSSRGECGLYDYAFEILREGIPITIPELSHEEVKFKLIRRDYDYRCDDNTNITFKVVDSMGSCGKLYADDYEGNNVGIIEGKETEITLNLDDNLELIEKPTTTQPPFYPTTTLPQITTTTQPTPSCNRECSSSGYEAGVCSINYPPNAMLNRGAGFCTGGETCWCVSTPTTTTIQPTTTTIQQECTKGQTIHMFNEGGTI